MKRFLIIAGLIIVLVLIANIWAYYALGKQPVNSIAGVIIAALLLYHIIVTVRTLRKTGKNPNRIKVGDTVTIQGREQYDREEWTGTVQAIDDFLGKVVFPDGNWRWERLSRMQRRQTKS